MTRCGALGLTGEMATPMGLLNPEVLQEEKVRIFRGLKFHTHRVWIAGELFQGHRVPQVAPGNCRGGGQPGVGGHRTGLVYHSLGDYSKAVVHHAQHLAIAKEVGDCAVEGNARTRQSLVFAPRKSALEGNGGRTRRRSRHTGKHPSSDRPRPGCQTGSGGVKTSTATPSSDFRGAQTHRAVFLQTRGAAFLLELGCPAGLMVRDGLPPPDPHHHALTMRGQRLYYERSTPLLAGVNIPPSTACTTCNL